MAAAVGSAPAGVVGATGAVGAAGATGAVGDIGGAFDLVVYGVIGGALLGLASGLFFAHRTLRARRFHGTAFRDEPPGVWPPRPSTPSKS